MGAWAFLQQSLLRKIQKKMEQKQHPTRVIRGNTKCFMAVTHFTIDVIFHVHRYENTMALEI